MMKNICLICTALLLVGMVACKPRSTKLKDKTGDRNKMMETQLIDEDNQPLTFTSRKINETEMMHQLTLRVNSNIYYHMVAITDLQPVKSTNGVPNFNEMEK